MPISRDEARRVKDKATTLARSKGPVVGVGLTKVGPSYAVKVNFSDVSSMAGLPAALDGVQIVYEVVGQPRARAGAKPAA